MIRWILALSGLIVFGCAPAKTTSEAADSGSSVAFTLSFAPTDPVPPGADATQCLTIGPSPDHDIWVGGWEVTKHTLHHVNLWLRSAADPYFRTITPSAASCLSTSPGGTVIFSDSFAGESWRQRMPDGDAMLIPAGSTFNIDAHHQNLSEKPEIQSVEIAFYETPPPEREVHSWTVLWAPSPALDLYPNSTKTVSFKATVPVDSSLISIYGHAHSRLTRETMSLDGAAVYDTNNWTDPGIVYPVGMRVGPTTKLIWSCSYENTGSTTVQWGASVTTNEMCAMEGLAEGPYWLVTGTVE